MKHILALVLVAALTMPAGAQAPAAAPFTPYTIGQQEHHALMNALGEIPAKYSMPLIQGLHQLQQQAAEQARKKNPDEPAK